MRTPTVETVGVLKKKETDILYYRFGLMDGTQWTLEAVGEKFDVSRERIRQIEHRALDKVKRSRKCRGLIEYLL